MPKAHAVNDATGSSTYNDRERIQISSVRLLQRIEQGSNVARSSDFAVHPWIDSIARVNEVRLFAELVRQGHEMIEPFTDQHATAAFLQERLHERARQCVAEGCSGRQWWWCSYDLEGFCLRQSFAFRMRDAVFEPGWTFAFPRR